MFWDFQDSFHSNQGSSHEEQNLEWISMKLNNARMKVFAASIMTESL